MRNTTDFNFTNDMVKNISSNGMGSEMVDHEHDDHEEDPLLDTILRSFSVCIAFFICFGNLMTILAILRNHRLKTIPNLYIASLAVADFLVGIMLFVRTFCKFISEGHLLQTEEYLCLSLMSMLFISVAASLFASFLVACDRYIYIMHSIRYAYLVTKERSLKAVCVMWVLATIYGSVPLYTSHFTEGEGCTPTHIFSFVYMVIVTPIMFTILSVSIFLLYFRIGKIAIRQSKEIRDQALNYSGSGHQRPITKRTWKVLKMLMIVFGLFCISWCPLIIIASLEYTVHIDHFILSIGSLLAVLNSGMNFVVLAFLNRDFRSEYKKILCVYYGRLCCCCRNTKVQTLNAPTVVSSTNMDSNYS